MVKEIMRLFGQYADDMDLYLQSDKTSLHEAISTFQKFEGQSGFKINYEKTTVYRIGSIKQSQAKYYSQNELNWVNTEINVLGVIVTDKKTELQKLNYEPIVRKAEATLKRWADRNLSLIGKVLIVNMLIGSLFVYKMSVLPTISPEIVQKMNRMIHAFLWNGKKAKISLEVLQCNKTDGGLGLVNLKKKDQALKISWVKSIKSDTFLSKLMENSLCPILEQDIWLCNLNTKDVKKLFKDSFWRDVLLSWSAINHESLIYSQEVNKIAESYLRHNSDIRINNIPFLFKDAYNAGLTQVCQLLSIDGGLMDIEITAKMFDLPIMHVNSIVSALPKKWKTLFKEKIELSNKMTTYELYSNCAKVSSKAYKEINSSTMPFQTAHIKWSRKNYDISYDDFCELFVNLYKCTNNAKLRSFQYRILHSAIITNIHLKKWKIKQSNLCTFCNLTEESVLHLMFQCQKTTAIWQEYVTNKLKSIAVEPFDINEKSVMENRIHTNPCHVFNFICLATKMYIYSSKCAQKALAPQALDAQIERYKNYEFYEAKKTNKLLFHCKKWFIPKQYNGTGLEDDFVREYVNNIN